ncbi:MAG: TonB-dependent receptor YncD precursor, partial [Sediminibacterium sp.]|nr:TonB-dependent receptor YncD precursor [Sediminibacterium sp.]
MKQLLFVLFGFIFPALLFSQKKDTILNSGVWQSMVQRADSMIDRVGGIVVVDTLQEVIVEAFHSRQQWKAVPAAVAIIGSKEINRYANTSFVPVFNTVPGVRVEERSPASYRLSIRGSLLRSPFGVRNVKVYWNEIPLSDAGGNTYLNLVDLNTLRSAEVIKGPAASVYGAGTGGAVLLRSDLNSPVTPENHFTAGVTGGSYGLFSEQLGWQYQSKNFSSSLQQVHQQSDGYREQSATRKDVVKWQGKWQLKKQQFNFLIFYTDLYYQTPGGITLAQFQSDPKLSRQAAGAIPGAIQQHASIYNKTIFGGVHHTLDLSDHFVLKSFLTGNHTSFTNPFITNYEKRGEANYGAGTSLIYKNKDFQWVNGAEWLYNHSLISDFGNRNGVADTVQFKDDIYATQWFAFSQAQLSFDKNWVLTVGLSLNNQSFRYKRLTAINPSFVNKSISLVLTPRMALLYKLTKDVSIYTLAAKGFSPPAVAEVRPSEGNYYGDLDAEYGWNFEAGIKGELFDDRLQFDVAAYFFSLQNAIVRRTNTSGAEYFVNAGGTKQNGIEALVKYQLIKGKSFGLNVWSSYSYQPYKFENYQQAGINYVGNAITGVPRNIWVSGIDMDYKGMYLNASINCTSSLPLTDANDVFADAYQLVQIKSGWRGYFKNDKMLDVFAGVDNALNQHYSLGNDINAVGKRYYNAA